MPISGPGVVVICSAPTTSTMRAALASMARMPCRTAAEPVAQAFSTRVAGLKRSRSSAWRTRLAVKSCGGKAGIEMAEHDLVDLVGTDAGMVERVGRDLDDQAFQRLAFELAEARMRPADDACGHGNLHPWRQPSMSARRTSQYCSNMNRLSSRREGPERHDRLIRARRVIFVD